VAPVVGESDDRETAARRLFLDESRRRVLSLLSDLRRFGEQFGCWPPPWMFERLAAIADKVMTDVEGAAALEDAIAAVEGELRNGLIDLVGTLADVPIPYVPIDPLIPDGARQVLKVLRGGLG
jgi:hypothetical protein